MGPSPALPRAPGGAALPDADAGLWEVVSFPAIAKIDEEHIVKTPFGRKTFVRRTGDALHAERESVETLARIRSAIGEYNFAGQYQQTPGPAGGGMVKEPWFRRYRPDQRPESFDQIAQSWDTANKPSELAITPSAPLGTSRDPPSISSTFCARSSPFPSSSGPYANRVIFFNPTVILIEVKASGTQLIEDLLDAGLSRVTPCKPDGDKIMRLHAQTATIENGFVHLPETAYWLADHIHELILFRAGQLRRPSRLHGAGARLDEIRPPGWGIFEYYRDFVAQANGTAPEPLVSLKTPPGEIPDFVGSLGPRWQSVRFPSAPPATHRVYGRFNYRRFWPE